MNNLINYLGGHLEEFHVQRNRGWELLVYAVVLEFSRQQSAHIIFFSASHKTHLIGLFAVHDPRYYSSAIQIKIMLAFLQAPLIWEFYERVLLLISIHNWVMEIVYRINGPHYWTRAPYILCKTGRKIWVCAVQFAAQRLRGHLSIPSCLFKYF